MPVLDARHLICPLPVIRTQDRIQHLEHGDELEVLCTDPGALHDIPAWCRVHGHEVLSIDEGAETIRVLVRVIRADPPETKFPGPIPHDSKGSEQ